MFEDCQGIHILNKLLANKMLIDTFHLECELDTLLLTHQEQRYTDALELCRVNTKRYTNNQAPPSKNTPRLLEKVLAEKAHLEHMNKELQASNKQLEHSHAVELYSTFQLSSVLQLKFSAALAAIGVVALAVGLVCFLNPPAIAVGIAFITAGSTLAVSGSIAAGLTIWGLYKAKKHDALDLAITHDIPVDMLV
ncbi:MAG: hypothetical protein H0U75_00415 [Legionella sp.]|nr:hypothetical protein [Legionella sp.]